MIPGKVICFYIGYGNSVKALIHIAKTEERDNKFNDNTLLTRNFNTSYISSKNRDEPEIIIVEAKSINRSILVFEHVDDEMGGSPPFTRPGKILTIRPRNEWAPLFLECCKILKSKKLKFNREQQEISKY